MYSARSPVTLPSNTSGIQQGLGSAFTMGLAEVRARRHRAVTRGSMMTGVVSQGVRGWLSDPNTTCRPYIPIQS